MQTLTTTNKTKNSLVSGGQKPTFSSYMSSPAVQQKINSIIKNDTTFTSALVSAVAQNPNLADCDFSTIFSAGLLGASLKLSPSSQLGQYYLVPFNDNKLGRKVAQFQLGYKGYIQLAIRSGFYKKLNVLAIKQGELVNYNPLEEEITVNLIQNDSIREKTATIGYYAMFEYTNGFRKTMYWSKEKMESHALKYSKGYQAKKGYTFWEKDFDGMAYKTMLRQLISKWGIMSIEMQNAYSSDMAVLKEDGEKYFVDEPQKEETINVVPVVETPQKEEVKKAPEQVVINQEPEKNNNVAAENDLLQTPPAADPFDVF